MSADKFVRDKFCDRHIILTHSLSSRLCCSLGSLFLFKSYILFEFYTGCFLSKQKIERDILWFILGRRGPINITLNFFIFKIQGVNIMKKMKIKKLKIKNCK